MRSQSLLVILSALILVTSALTGCERDAQPRSDDEAKTKRAAEPSGEDPVPDKPDKPDEANEPASKPGPAPSRPPDAPEPLVDALEAPDKAVTSEGRFRTIMERGLSEYMPEFGLMYGAGGIEQPGLRVAIAADGRGRWARGKGPYWSDLEESGDFELEDDEVARLADIVARAWTEDVEYKPSSVEQTRVVILRDGKTARVFEHSSVPASLAELEEIMLDHVPDPSE